MMTPLSWMRWTNSYILHFKGAIFGWSSRCRQVGICCWLRPAKTIWSLAYFPSHTYPTFFKSYFDTDICIKLAQMAKDFMLLCLKHLLYFTVNILYNIHAPTQICIYICVCVSAYICAFVYINVCICQGVRIWGYWYAHINVCVGECVFAILSTILNLLPYRLYITYNIICVFASLCTLMLYICDRSTHDLNKEDELT